MGRQPPKHLSDVGSRIREQMELLGLDPQQIAAAAGLSPSTLYRLMRLGGTSDPRLSTKRQLAKALKIPMAQLFAEAQLEFLDQHEPSLKRGPTPLEKLILGHFQELKRPVRKRAARAAALALVDMILAVSPEPSPKQVSDAFSAPANEDAFEQLILDLFRKLPWRVRKTGARVAIQAMLNVQMAMNQTRNKPLYRSITRATWSVKRLLRHTPPLDDVKAS